MFLSRLVHGPYLKWQLRTCCACMKENRSFRKKEFDLWLSRSNQMPQTYQKSYIAPCSYTILLPFYGQLVLDSYFWSLLKFPWGSFYCSSALLARQSPYLRRLLQTNEIWKKESLTFWSNCVVLTKLKRVCIVSNSWTPCSA